MKKITALFLVIAFTICLVASCGKADETSSSTTSETVSSSTSDSTTDSTAVSTAPPETEPPIEYEYEDEEGLILHLAFDTIENGLIKDVTGNGHDATLSGDPKITESGRVNQALRFSKAGQYLTIQDCEDLNFTENDSFTAEIYYKWVGLTSGTSWPCLFQKGLSVSENAYQYFGLWINSSNRMLNLGITGNGGTQTYNLSSYLTVDTGWHQAVIIQNAEEGTISLYIDGTFRSAMLSILEITEVTDNLSARLMTLKFIITQRILCHMKKPIWA